MLVDKESRECTVFSEAIEPGSGMSPIKRIGEQSDRENVSISAGAYVMSEGDDIRTAMRIADERMYADKALYYEKHPDKKYR